MTAAAFRGKYGCIIDSGHQFITSSNFEFIFAPPFRESHKIYMRWDFHFADDDYTLWPQPFYGKYPHLAVIPRKPFDMLSDSAENLLWWSLDDTTFVSIPINFVRGFSKLLPEKLQQFRAYVDKQLAWCWSFIENPKNKLYHLFVRILSTSLSNSMIHLESIPTSRRRIRFTIAELQRRMLELEALFRFNNIIYPRIIGELPPATETEWTIGAFSTNAEVIQNFFRGGIPVWFIWPFASLPDVAVDNVAEMMFPHQVHFLDVRPADPPFEVAFTGSATDLDKFLGFAQFIRSYDSIRTSFDKFPHDHSEDPATQSSLTSVQDFQQPGNPFLASKSVPAPGPSSKRQPGPSPLPSESIPTSRHLSMSVIRRQSGLFSMSAAGSSNHQASRRNHPCKRSLLKPS